MGNTQFNKQKCASQLRQANTRLNIHRSKKLNAISKLKDDISKHLNSNNEVNAKIWAETLINDEGIVPCYDITHTMCDQIAGRLDYIAKFGAPPDMSQTFATVIHVAPKLAVEELMEVRKQLVAILGKEFELQADEDKKILNPIVGDNIDFRKPMDGEIIYRLRQLAKERNINYTPSHDSQMALNHYLDFKGLLDPMDEGKGPAQLAAPVYNPQPIPPLDLNPPPGMPPGGGNMSLPPPQYPMQPPAFMPPYQPPAAYEPMPPPVNFNHPPPQGIPFDQNQGFPQQPNL